MKSNEKEIKRLQDHLDTYRIEIESKQREYSNSIKSKNEEIEALKAQLREQDRQARDFMFAKAGASSIHDDHHHQKVPSLFTQSSKSFIAPFDTDQTMNEQSQTQQQQQQQSDSMLTFVGGRSAARSTLPSHQSVAQTYVIDPADEVKSSNSVFSSSSSVRVSVRSAAVNAKPDCADRYTSPIPQVNIFKKGHLM